MPSSDKTLKVQVYEPKEIRASTPQTGRAKKNQVEWVFESQKSLSRDSQQSGVGAVSSTLQRSPSVKDQKNSHFVISSLAKSAKDLEEEKRNIIEKEVSERVSKIKTQAEQDGEKKGFQEGFDKGFQDGTQSAQESIEKTVKKFTDFLVQLDQAKNVIFEHNERFLIDLIYRIARMVLLKELTKDREYLVRLAKTLIERTGVRENITLQISSEDAEMIDILKGGLIQQFGTLKNLSIEVSSQVKPGGASIETEWSTIETNIEEQLEKIRASLLGEVKKEAS